jgi:hypothetical protein
LIKPSSFTAIDYLIKFVGVVALATIAFYSGEITNKVESLVDVVRDHEFRLRALEK